MTFKQAELLRNVLMLSHISSYKLEQRVTKISCKITRLKGDPVNCGAALMSYPLLSTPPFPLHLARTSSNLKVLF